MAVRPITTWPGMLRNWSQRKSSNFSAPWSATLDLLGKEIRALGGRAVVLEVAIPPEQFRNDGYPRANARESHPGVILSLGKSHVGPLRYPCDAFDRWQDNVRAIALALEALRRVDRYGVTKRGEQYQGWAQIESSDMTRNQALEVIGLAEHFSADEARAAWRTARIRWHPDRNSGNHTEWDRVERAARALGLTP
jgi:hypothetical protein